MDHVQKGERHITQVHMGTLSAAEVRQRSCAEVLDIKASSHDIPVMYSIIDARMGSVERNILCATCKSPGCRTGHPGHIELPMPIYHPLFKDKYICPTLMSVCFFCGGVLIPEFLVQRMSASTQRPDVNETIAEKRFSEYFRYVEQNQNSRRPKCAVHCPRAECGMPQPIYQKCKTSITCYWRLYDVMELHPRLLSLLFTEVEQVQIQQRSEAWKRQIEIELEKDPKYAANLATATRLHGVLRALALPIHMTRFSSYEALRILHSISDDGLRALGFDPKCSRPADMVLTALYVPPVNVRPHSGGVGRARSWNPLSLQYIDVLRLCNEFRHEMEESKIPFNNEICPFPNRVVPPKFLHYASVIFVCLAGFMEKKMGEKLAALCHQQPKQIAPPSDWERAPPHAVAAAEKLIQQCSISSAPAARDDDDTSDDESNVNMTSIDQRSSAAATLKAPKTPRAKKTLTTSTQMASKRITSKAMRNFVPRDTKGIMDNLNGKEGFIRKYMTGKRCDFTARTVIAPDNDLDPRELGVPVLIAFHLTFAERVTDLNIASLQERVRRGPHHIVRLHLPAALCVCLETTSVWSNMSPLYMSDAVCVL